MISRPGAVILFAFLLFAFPAHAASQSQTAIVNQVRGPECCEQGSALYFNLQINTLNRLKLPATFALRYDALSNPAYTQPLKSSPYEPAAFLEIIPSLAKKSGVAYTGTSENWYKAEHAYLVGYMQDDRQKLIDTYMRAFHTVFKRYPKTTVGWVIDAWSLQYLKETYGVLVHEITREQFGTDSYTLYGGPPHYPYSPSSAWAMIPSYSTNPEMPLIIRQTITDPEMNYGDVTSSYTSQPNDYMLRDADISYFVHLFTQAHNQPLSDSTWALIGLENSMPRDVQDEFVKQLEIVASWRDEKPSHQIVTAEEFTQKTKLIPYPHVYASQQAWWITTPSYRARVRLDNQELYLDDIRIYDKDFTDPYDKAQADQNAQWIVPFVLDGSRYFHQDPVFRIDGIAKDELTERENNYPEPTRLTLASNIKDIVVKRSQNTIIFSSPQSEKPLATFQLDSFELPSQTVQKTSNPLLDRTVKNLVWQSESGEKLWGLRVQSRKGQKVYTPFAQHPQSLETEREKHYPLLFPTVKERPLDPQTTYIHFNNVYAVAGRNPVRVVLYPLDAYRYPVKIAEFPSLQTADPIDATNIDTQQIQNGMIFLDFTHAKPIRTTATVQLGAFSRSFHIYYAPNCKQNALYCLRHPVQATWYVRSYVGDVMRKLRE